MSRSQLAELLKSISGLKTDSVTTQKGQTILLARISMLCPTGLRFIGDHGIEMVPFQELPVELIESTGWNLAIAEKYATERKLEGKAATHAIQEIQKEMLKNQSAEAAKQVRDAEFRLAHNGDAPPPEPPIAISRAIRAKARGHDDLSDENFEIEQQFRDYEKLKKMREHAPSDVPKDVFKKVVAEAENNWPLEYGMMVYSIEEEPKAYRKLHRPPP